MCANALDNIYPLTAYSHSGLCCRIIISLVQAITQLQDQTLPFLLKIIAVFATLALTYHWIGTTIINFSSIIFEMIPKVNG